jgi:hypothetical protein
MDAAADPVFDARYRYMLLSRVENAVRAVLRRLLGVHHRCCINLVHQCAVAPPNNPIPSATAYSSPDAFPINAIERAVIIPSTICIKICIHTGNLGFRRRFSSVSLTNCTTQQYRRKIKIAAARRISKPPNESVCITAIIRHTATTSKIRNFGIHLAPFSTRVRLRKSRPRICWAALQSDQDAPEITTHSASP